MTSEEYLLQLRPLVTGIQDDIARILYFCAFSGGDISDYNLKKYAHHYKLNFSKLANQVRSLIRDGWLIENYDFSIYGTRTELQSRLFFPTAFRLMKFHPGLVTEFGNIGSRRTNYGEWMWETARYIFNGMEDHVRWDMMILPPSQEYAVFMNVWRVTAFKKGVLSLDDKNFSKMVQVFLESGLDYDTLDEQQFSDLDQLLTGMCAAKSLFWNDDTCMLLDMIGLYRYIFCGTAPGTAYHNGSFWSKAADAVEALYSRDIDLSLRLFSESLKMRNKLCKDKNLYYTPILSLLLIAAYKMADTEETRKKVSQFLNKSKSGNLPELNAAFTAAEYIGSTTMHRSDMIEYAVRRARRYGAPADNSFAMLLAGCLKVPLGNIFKDAGAVHPPKCALLRYELSPFMEVPDRDRLRGIFGGEPLFSSISTKEPWEYLLAEVSSGLDRVQAKGGQTVRQQRICYVVNRYNVRIMMQEWLKSGRWSSPRNVSAGSFMDKALPYMDEIDHTVASALDYPSSCYSHEEILPYLAGCPRVFLDSSDNQPVSIEEEKPYLCLKEDPTGYALSTNMPVFHGHAKTAGVIMKDSTHYVTVRIDKQQKAVIESLMQITHYPKSAAGALKELMIKLENILEVRTPFSGESGGAIWKDGQCRLTVRLIPGKDRYHANLLIYPLEGSTRSFYPGRGERTYNDTAGEQRYRLTRNIRGERDNLREISDFLENELGLDQGDEDSSYVLDTAGLLSLLEFVQERKEDFCVEWPEGKSLRIKGSLISRQVSINFTSGEKWFEAEGEATLSDGSRLSLNDLLRAVASGAIGGRYVRLGEDEYMVLSESLLSQLRKIEAVSQQASGKGSRIPLLQIGQLASVLHRSGMAVSSDGGPEKLEKAMREAAGLQPEIPSGLQAVLRDYQADGFRWMVRLDHWGAGGCLADDMGLGKTVQAIAFLLYKAAEGPSLVVAPASVVLNWSSELARFAPGLNVRILNSADDRSALLENAVAGDIVLTSYRLLATEREALSAIRWNTVCLDEAHTIKNRSSTTAAAAMSLHARSRLTLTGTPVQNYLGELWSLFQFLNPGLLGSYQHFAERFINTASEEDSRMRRQQLRRIISPFILRRTKAEVAEELPEKTDIIRRIVLSDSERTGYELMRERARKAVESSDKVSVNILSDITRLRMAACDPALTGNSGLERSSKTEAFMELASEILSGGNRILVFSQFTSYLKRVCGELDSMGMEYFYLDGSVPVARRAEMVGSFQKGERNLFLISLKAGGLGLNLTGANYVIHLDPWWNPAVEQQATDRAYRIGQQQNVTVYHLISEHTIEEKILRLHKTKRDLADAILEGQGTGRAITLEELRDMLDIR